MNTPLWRDHTCAGQVRLDPLLDSAQASGRSLDDLVAIADLSIDRFGSREGLEILGPLFDSTRGTSELVRLAARAEHRYKGDEAEAAVMLAAVTSERSTDDLLETMKTIPGHEVTIAAIESRRSIDEVREIGEIATTNGFRRAGPTFAKAAIDSARPIDESEQLMDVLWDNFGAGGKWGIFASRYDGHGAAEAFSSTYSLEELTDISEAASDAFTGNEREASAARLVFGSGLDADAGVELLHTVGADFGGGDSALLALRDELRDLVP